MIVRGARNILLRAVIGEWGDSNPPSGLSPWAFLALGVEEGADLLGLGLGEGLGLLPGGGVALGDGEGLFLGVGVGLSSAYPGAVGADVAAELDPLDS